MRILGLIPARGGSKGVPRKNIRLLGNKPLLQYTAEAALAAHRLSRVVLSTEDTEIAEVGRSCGLDVPFMRPHELAQDTTPTLPVVQHALNWLFSHGDAFDAVCLLQPTHPFRSASTIDACIEKFESVEADSLVTMLPVPAVYNPHWVYFSDTQGFLKISTGEETPIPRRQDLPPAFHREGSIYITRTEVVLSGSSLYGKKMIGFLAPESESVNIDTMQDWNLAEQFIHQRGS